MIAMKKLQRWRCRGLKQMKKWAERSRPWLPGVVVCAVLLFSCFAAAQGGEESSDTARRTRLNWIGYASVELGHNAGSVAPPYADITLSGGYYASFDMAAYVTGPWAGAYELTAAYDHARGQASTVFDDGAGVYPVFGDAGTRLDDASSREPLFVSVEGDRMRFLYGDYETGLDAGLAPYRRSLTGPRVDAVFPLGDAAQELEISVMGARTTQVPHSDLIPAAGTAGFYRLSHGRIVPGSERVELAKYDPARRDEPVELRRLRRGIDYTIDHVDGTLLFSQPIPIQDSDGYLNFIWVHYEYEPGGSGSLRDTYAARGVYRSERLELGATWVSETGGDTAWGVTGVDARVRLSDRVDLVAEAAGSRSDNGTSRQTGGAYAVELHARPVERVGASIYHRTIEPGFEFSAEEYASSGTTHTGAAVTVQHGQSLNTRVGWETERRETGIATGEQERSVTSLGAVYRQGPWTLSGQLHVGTLSTSAAGAGVERFDTRGGGVSVDHRLSSGGTVGLSREMEWARPEAGGDVQQAGATTLRYQAGMGTAMSWSVGYTVTDAGGQGAWLGLDTRIYDSDVLTTTVFSRWRLDGAASGLNGQAWFGLANQWQVTPHVSADLHYEVVADRGQPVPQATNAFPQPPAQNALSIALAYEPDATYTAAVRYNQHHGERGTRRLTEVTSLGRLGADVSLFVQAMWSDVELSGTHAARATQTVGMAYRPVDNERVNALLSYEHGTRRGPRSDQWQEEHTWSVEGSYWMTATVEVGAKLAQRQRHERTPPAAATDSVTNLYQLRTTVEMAPRVDLNGVYRRLHQRPTDIWQVGWQASFGYRFIPDDPRWLVEAGYRYADYAPEDDPSSDAFVTGPFVRLTYVF